MDRAQPASSPRQEGTYRYNAESILEDEAMYKLEYVSNLLDTVTSQGLQIHNMFVKH